MNFLFLSDTDKNYDVKIPLQNLLYYIIIEDMQFTVKHNPNIFSLLNFLDNIVEDLCDMKMYYNECFCAYMNTELGIIVSHLLLIF